MRLSRPHFDGRVMCRCVHVDGFRRRRRQTGKQVMRHMLLFPQHGGDVDGGIDRQVGLPPPHPRRGVVGAHHGRENQGGPVDGGFQWLTISGIENGEGRFCGFHDSTCVQG